MVIGVDRVSRTHALPRFVSGQGILEGARSRNGTFANGRRVKQVVVVPGTEIGLGDPTGAGMLTVRALDERPDDPPDGPALPRDVPRVGQFRQPAATRSLGPFSGAGTVMRI